MKKKISMVLLASVIASNVAPAINVFAEEVLKEQADVIIEKAVSESKITNFNLKDFSNFEKYNLQYKVQKEDILSISANGGQYSSSSIDKAIDGNTSTHWETGKANSSSFTNEVVFEFENIENIDRIAYATRQDGAKGKGYPTKFEIYASVTGNEDDFTLVSTGSSSSTGNMMQFKFDTVNAKKIKFIFSEANQSWASASEFWFYREDKIIDKLNNIFTDDNKNQLSEEFNTLEKINAFEEEAKNHPLYDGVKEDINNAKLILAGNNVAYKDAIVSQFKSFTDGTLVEYNKLFKLNISSISTNGSHYGTSNIEKAIDGDINTSWHSGKQNSSSHTNEVILTLDKLETLDRVVYTSLVSRGFAKAFDIYVSKTTTGDTFEKVTSGTSNITNNSLEIQFNPTEARRVKFVYKEGYENWALASEFALYKVDELKDKISRLFTDSTMGEVSAEFNTLEKIEQLENEAKNHPFYGDYKEDLSNARELVANEKAEATKAEVSKFTPFYTEYDNAYSEAFRMPNSNIAKISNNGGSYSGTNLNFAIDDNINTHWETKTPNSSTFKNEVLFELNEAKVLDRIVYKARSSNKGFAEEFEIYGSSTTKGDNYRLISTGNASVTSDLLEFKFAPTKFKRIKFVFKKANQDWASVGEFRFYSEDKLSQKMNSLFKDGLYTQLNEEFNSIEAIEALEKELVNHPLEGLYAEDISLAKQIINNDDNIENIKTYVAEQRGSYGYGTSVRSINGNAFTFQSTGKYVTPGERIVVYVDADENGPLPTLGFGQAGMNKGAWLRWQTLQPGKNVIVVPTDVNPCAIYINNEATPKNQAYAPKLRIDGGTSFPTYIHGETDPKAFAEEVREYAKKVEYKDEAFVNGNPEGKVFNIVELVSENCIVTTSAAGAVEAFKEMDKTNLTVEDTMNEWEEMYEMFQTFQGFEKDAEEEKDSYFPNKFVGRVFQGIPLGFAAHGYTGYLGSDNAERNGRFFKQIVLPITHGGNDNWIYNHEFGHIFNTKYVVDGEVTNNLYAQEYRRIKGLGGDRANWSELMKRFKGEEFAMHYFERLAVLSQINMVYGYDAYAKMSRYVRNNTDQIKAISGSDQQRLVVAYSLALNVDLLDFFEGWNYVTVTEQMREAVSSLPKLDKKMEYLHGKAYDYAGNGFDKNLDIEVKSNINEEEKTNTLSFAIDSENSDDLLGYEILKDGEVIGFTRDNSFVVKNVDVKENANYQVVAYAKDLSTGKAVQVNAFSPVITTQQNSVMVALNSEFNAENYVKGFTYKNEDISNDITIESNVDTSKKGTYKVTYTLTNNNTKVEKVMEVEVVSSYDYLSDTAWNSVETQWGTPRRNSNIKGRVNGEITTFEKGFGIHANGKIVYNLGEHNYETFEALLGVDMTIAANDNSSITFKVTGDGETLATTKVLKHADNMTAISVPVKGVKQLVIEVNNGGNGNTSDHAVIANPKLSNNNTKPKLTIPSTVSTKIGEKVDLDDKYSAFDIEDGNLTSEVKVEGKVNFNKSGKYEITYSVTDSDGNTTKAIREVKVVDMEHSEYLSDINWKSSVNSYTAAKKDQSINGNGLRLTDEDGSIVTYNKGIGAHSTSTLTYDLTKGDYGYFTSFIGVDRNVYGSVGSVGFQVYLDNEKVYDSGVMTSKQAQKFVEVNLAGAKELKLVVTDGQNGNGSDHAIWADAKLHLAKEGSLIETENQKTLRELIEYADTLTEDMVGEQRFKEIVWANFNYAKDEAIKALADSDKTEEELYRAEYFLNYTIEDLKLVK